MSRSERERPPPRLSAPSARYGSAVAVVGLVLLAFITINTLTTHPRGADGIVPGERVPPFAVPTALGNVQGDANIATHNNDGSAGTHAACTVRGAGILNVCELYEKGPVVLALVVDSGGCEDVLYDMQALKASFPGVRFAGVALAGERAATRQLIAAHGLTFPVGLDKEATLAEIYKVSSCPQVSFVYPGGVMQSKALLTRPSRAVLRARIAALVAGAKARGWR
jgi:hypothetical protein